MEQGTHAEVRERTVVGVLGSGEWVISIYESILETLERHRAGRNGGGLAEGHEKDKIASGERSATCSEP